VAPPAPYYSSATVLEPEPAGALPNGADVSAQKNPTTGGFPFVCTQRVHWYYSVGLVAAVGGNGPLHLARTGEAFKPRWPVWHRRRRAPTRNSVAQHGNSGPVEADRDRRPQGPPRPREAPPPVPERDRGGGGGGGGAGVERAGRQGCGVGARGAGIGWGWWRHGVRAGRGV
jgi:hypothetical protein